MHEISSSDDLDSFLSVFMLSDFTIESVIQFETHDLSHKRKIVAVGSSRKLAINNHKYSIVKFMYLHVLLFKIAINCSKIINFHRIIN